MAKIVLGRTGATVAHCTVWRFSIFDYSSVRRLIRQMIPNHQFHWIIPVPTVVSCVQLLAINRYGVFSIAVVRQFWILRYPPSSVGVCSSTSLSLCAIHILSSPIASDKMFGDVFRRFDPVVSRYIAIPAQIVSSVSALAHMTQDAID